MAEHADQREVYHGSLINLLVRTTAEPHGGTSRYEVVEHPAAVAIVAIRDDLASGPCVALVRQLRPALGRDLWEIPAGIIPPEEADNPQLTGARELREETGTVATRWRLLAREYPSPGFSTETVSIYLAAGVVPLEGESEDPTEIAEIRWMPLDEALTLRARGEVEDGKTMLGLMLAASALGQPAASEGSEAEMPLDPTNMPFQRGARYRVADDAAAQPEHGGRDRSLKLEDMLLEEFNYANITAYQALEDRARMFNLYLIVMGVFASGLGAIYQFGHTSLGTYTVPLVCLLLVVAGILGIAFFAKQVRLRQAYVSSLLAMNVIKEFFIAQFEGEMPLAPKAFLWRITGVPLTERFGRVTFIVCATVAFLELLCFAAAVFVGYARWSLPVIGARVPLLLGAQPFLAAVLVAGALGLVHIPFYRHALDNRKPVAAALRTVNEVRTALGLEPLEEPGI